MKNRLITVGLFASIFSVAYIAPASAQEYVASLTLYGSGLPGLFDAYPDVNPLPPQTFQLKTFSFPLAGTEQIPLDAVIKWVKIGSMTHGRFDDGVFPVAGVSVRLFMSNGGSTYPLTPSGQFGLEAYGLDNEYNVGGGFSLNFSPFTNTAWTRDEAVNLTVGWWGRWASGSQTAWAERLSVIAYPVEIGFQVPGSPASYSVSPTRLNLSTGDTNRFITTTASRPTIRMTPSFTIGSTSN